ncbi:uncharacterized protein NDAI_0A02100 [Naumovozyma dairenensis CBS 421]|uniref:2-dehydropantoate 2-reductase n=1 Tax=Naumovozyma dairenensis (strain ATCC 10597 / BCRC 20456 / CBS 421 / NBRC 0211 / NRRL Y-12639) TaxID=1071378 RepID=G0W3I0_NAUDC|nr:hypothetical protein NDAI_0A02100 [Naumovozyma dairenensis CBS 421]CCD22368.1 hypothetical protein NDAI_0A02100 [Naumovozyma dairenensis CBS 421]
MSLPQAAATAPIPNVLVIGAGGVGVITALSLYIRKLSHVSMVIRSDYDHVTANGYQIDSCDYGHISNWKPHSIYRTAYDASQSGLFFNYLVITTKNIPDGPVESRVSNIIKPILESNRTLQSEELTNIILIQNGIDIEKEIVSKFNKDDYKYSLLSGIQLIGSTKIGKGIIKQIGKDHLSVGAFDACDRKAIHFAQVFVELYGNEGKKILLSSMQVVSLFKYGSKLLYNAAINTTTALVGLDVPRCLEFAVDKKSTEMEIFEPAMREIIKIAASEGIILEEQFVGFFANITRNKMFKPSMCVDEEKGQLMELEVILGNPLKIAKRNGIETPLLSMLYNLLVLVQGKLKEGNGLIKFNEDTCRMESE